METKVGFSSAASPLYTCKTDCGKLCQKRSKKGENGKCGARCAVVSNPVDSHFTSLIYTSKVYRCLQLCGTVDLGTSLVGKFATIYISNNTYHDLYCAYTCTGDRHCLACDVILRWSTQRVALRVLDEFAYIDNNLKSVESTGSRYR